MAENETGTKDQGDDLIEGGALDSEAIEKSEGDEAGADEASADVAPPTNLGATKYVHAAFFVVGIAVAFITGRILAGIWNALAAWPPAVRAVPQLLLYGEDERPSFTIVVGVLVGILVVAQMFRNPGIRQWSDDVATELTKVVWPSRETVTNNTIVVIVASALATIYVGLLDRLWAFVTMKIYGA